MNTYKLQHLSNNTFRVQVNDGANDAFIRRTSVGHQFNRAYEYSTVYNERSATEFSTRDQAMDAVKWLRARESPTVIKIEDV